MDRGKITKILFPLMAFLGFVDSLHLYNIHYEPDICGTPQIFLGFTFDCGSVARSEYSTIFSIPLAVIGMIYYLTVMFLFLYRNDLKLPEQIDTIQVLSIIVGTGLIFSLFLLYLQIVVIKSICLYCVFSLITTSILMILLVLMQWKR